MDSPRLRLLTVSVTTLVLAGTAACAAEEPNLEEAGDADTAEPAEPAETEAATSETEGEQVTVRMQLSWIPDCQFAGYLQADEQGIYAEHGVDVELLPGGPNVNAIQQVVTGAADLTVNKAGALYAARDQAFPSYR